MVGITCSVPGCRNRNDSSYISFFRFPSEPSRRQKWIEILGIDAQQLSQLSDPKVCSEHFKGSQFTSRNKVWLTKTALPFRNQKLNKTGQKEQQLKSTQMPKKRKIQPIKSVIPPIPEAQVSDESFQKNSNQEVEAAAAPWIIVGSESGGFHLTQVQASHLNPSDGSSEISAISSSTTEGGNYLLIVNPSISPSVSFPIFSEQIPSLSGRVDFDPINHCLMCNANSVDMNSNSKDSSLSLEEIQRVTSQFLEILNLKISDLQYFNGQESIPFCLACLRQIQLLVNMNEDLRILQERFDAFKFDLVNSLTVAFYKRKLITEEDECTRDFLSCGNTFSSRMTEKFIGTRYKLFVKKQKSEPTQLSESNLVLPDDNFCSSDSEIEERESELSPDLGKVEICLQGKKGTERMKQKWEALSSCPATKAGLEKLLPFHLRRVTCPICDEKVPPSQISRHLTVHSAQERRSYADIEAKLLSTSTEIVKGKMRRKIINAKWRALVKTSAQKDGTDTHIPIHCRRVKCPTCQKEIGLAYLSSHLNTHTGERPYKCPLCPKSFAGKSNLVSHRQVHAKKIPFRFNIYFCDLCEKGRKFQFRSNYVRHILKDHSSTVGTSDVLYFYNCDMDGCKESYRNREQFFEHLMTHNEEGITFACPYLGCQKIFASSQNCETHLVQLHGSNTEINSTAELFDCKYCPKVCANEKDWSEHELTHGIDMSTEQRTHLCEECGKGFKTKLQFWTHKHNVRSHSLKDREFDQEEPKMDIQKNSKVTKKRRQYNRRELLSNCQFCEKRITSSSSMTNHLLDVHTYENKLMCYICNQDFRKLTCLEAHIRRHLGLPRKTCKEKCMFCGEEFAYVISLREHCVKMHAEAYLTDKPFYCPICWFRFETEEELSPHHLKFHERWKCTHCGKQLQNRLRYEDHIRIHTGESPFSCHLCPKTFRMQVNLKEHIMRHNGEKPYYCSLCPTKTGFFRKKMLRAHMDNVHTHTILGENVISFSITEALGIGTTEGQRFQVLEIMDVDGLGE